MKIQLILIPLIASSTLVYAADKNTGGGAEILIRCGLAATVRTANRRPTSASRCMLQTSLRRPCRNYRIHRSAASSMNGKEKMRHFNETLSSAEIKSVVAYVRQLAKK